MISQLGSSAAVGLWLWWCSASSLQLGDPPGLPIDFGGKVYFSHYTLGSNAGRAGVGGPGRGAALEGSSGVSGGLAGWGCTQDAHQASLPLSQHWGTEGFQSPQHLQCCSRCPPAAQGQVWCHLCFHSKSPALSLGVKSSSLKQCCVPLIKQRRRRA